MAEPLDEDLALLRQRTVSVFVVEPAIEQPVKTASAGPASAKTVSTEPKRLTRKNRSLIEWSVVLVAALTVALLVRAFIFGAFYIPSNSMEPVLNVGDRILVNKLSYIASEPSHGDLVVFLPPETATNIADTELVKRVVAVGGETVEFIDETLLLNGVPIEEEYLLPIARTPDFALIVVPDDHVFVMGDNRSNSLDSRKFGPVPVGNVIGRAFIIYWPPSSIGTL